MALTSLKLPDTLQDYYQTYFSKPASSETVTHCNRELMQEIWKLLLDDKFSHAYKHGLVIKCWDGISRRFYPRLFTYSADYKEK
jgi:hypothetical protein